MIMQKPGVHWRARVCGKQPGSPPGWSVRVPDGAMLVVSQDTSLGTACRRSQEKSRWRLSQEPATRGRVTGNKCVVSAATRRDTAKKCPTQSVFFSYQVPTGHKGPARTGALEETPVEGIVLDTGAAKTMSQQDSEQQIGYRPTIAFTDLSFRLQSSITFYRPSTVLTSFYSSFLPFPGNSYCFTDHSWHLQIIPTIYRSPVLLYRPSIAFTDHSYHFHVIYTILWTSIAFTDHSCHLQVIRTILQSIHSVYRSFLLFTDHSYLFIDHP